MSELLETDEDQVRFKQLLDFAERLRARYLQILAAFKIFEEFKKVRATDIVGQEMAELNISIFNQYKYFVFPSGEALRCYFLIGLAKCFDEDRRTVSVKNIIAHAKRKIGSFSVDEFVKYYEGRENLSEVSKNFKALSEDDLLKIENRLSGANGMIKKLKAYRDQYLAHDDTKKEDVPINDQEVASLMDIVKDAIDLIYNRVALAGNCYINYEEEPVRDLQRLIRALREHEADRIEKINKKYGS